MTFESKLKLALLSGVLAALGVGSRCNPTCDEGGKCPEPQFGDGVVGFVDPTSLEIVAVTYAHAQNHTTDGRREEFVFHNGGFAVPEDFASYPQILITGHVWSTQHGSGSNHSLVDLAKDAGLYLGVQVASAQAGCALEDLTAETCSCLESSCSPCNSVTPASNMSRIRDRLRVRTSIGTVPAWPWSGTDSDEYEIANRGTNPTAVGFYAYRTRASGTSGLLEYQSFAGTASAGLYPVDQANQCIREHASGDGLSAGSARSQIHQHFKNTHNVTSAEFLHTQNTADGRIATCTFSGGSWSCAGD